MTVNIINDNKFINDVDETIIYDIGLSMTLTIINDIDYCQLVTTLSLFPVGIPVRIGPQYPLLVVRGD